MRYSAFMPIARDPLYRRHRFPPEVISQAVWLYFRSPLSLRMVEEMLAARGIDVTYETVRHAAGERLFVDYAGDGAPVVIDRLTGEIRMAQIFVAVLGASSFTFVHATWTQALPDWIDAHVHAFEAIAGVPELVVPDDTKTAIVRACFYEPQVNRTYAEMAAHYGTAILPARPRKPRDKGSDSYCTS